MVFGEGNPDATILFIGEAPGEQEAKTGRPLWARRAAIKPTPGLYWPSARRCVYY